MNNQLETRIKSALINGRLPCLAAFAIARDLNLELKEVGIAVDKLGIRVSDCQLGLFGKPHKA